MTFIWKIILATVCYIYSTVIRSVLMYEAVIWHMSSNVNRSETTHQNYKNESVKKLVKMQNKCLWIITDAYKIMLMTILEIKTHTLLLNLYLNTKLVSFHWWHKKSDMKKMIRKTCEKIWKCFCHDNVSRNLIINKRQML